MSVVFNWLIHACSHARGRSQCERGGDILLYCTCCSLHLPLISYLLFYLCTDLRGGTDQFLYSHVTSFFTSKFSFSTLRLSNVRFHFRATTHGLSLTSRTT